ncbi:hypothetical protein VP01_1859g2, partial [Puccinia sorghi]
MTFPESCLQKINHIKTHLHPRNLPCPQNQLLRSQPFEESPRKTEKEDYLIIIKWPKIEWNYNSCFGTGETPAVGYKYKKVHTKSIATGFGLTNEDRKAGICTINEKLESMCPHYHVMNKLMGGQAFINPWFK